MESYCAAEGQALSAVKLNYQEDSKHLNIEKQLTTVIAKIEKCRAKIAVEQEKLLKLEASRKALENQRILDAASQLSSAEAVALLQKGAKE